MDFEFTQEQILFGDTAHKFAEKEILPFLKIPPKCRGELFACGAAVEPNAWSDASKIETIAAKSGKA